MTFDAWPMIEARPFEQTLTFRALPELTEHGLELSVKSAALAAEHTLFELTAGLSDAGACWPSERAAVKVAAVEVAGSLLIRAQDDRPYLPAVSPPVDPFRDPSPERPSQERDDGLSRARARATMRVDHPSVGIHQGKPPFS